MKYNFSYRLAGQNEILDSMVETFSNLVDAAVSKNKDVEAYKENNKLFSEAIVKFCVEASNKEYTGLDMVKDPMVTVNSVFRDTFATVISQVITPLVPKITSERYNSLYDVTQVGFGDNASYIVESNELFIVNEGAEGISRGGQQTTANNEYTVTAHKRQIGVGVDWYHVASGKMDWGMFGLKVAKSFENYINASVIKALTSVVSDATQRTSKGIGGYYANGITDTNWLTLERNVSAVNGGAPVYALGTKIGLAEVLPTAEQGFRFGSGDPVVVHGTLPMYKDVPLIEIDNALNPYTINGTPSAIVDDNYIYFIAMGTDKPVKVVFEGNQVTVAVDPMTTNDRTFGMHVEMRLGTDVIVGNKFGVLMK